MNLEKQTFELVEDYVRSGKTQREYNLLTRRGRAKFNYLVYKYKTPQGEPSAGFIKVETTPGKQDQHMEILYLME